jgi:hypothetical protein
MQNAFGALILRVKLLRFEYARAVYQHRKRTRVVKHRARKRTYHAEGGQRDHHKADAH